MKTPDDMPQAPAVYAYIRFSTEEQRDGDSLGRQSRKAREFAAARGLGPVDVETYVDAGVSAYRGDNETKGTLGKFIARAKRGEIRPGDWLIVENLDRLSRRSLEDAYPLLTSITSAGVLVGVCDGGQVFRKGAYDLTTFLRWACSQELAHEESKKKSERLCAAWASKRAKIGERKLTAKCPGWLELSADKTTFRVIDERAAVVKRIFNETAAGLGVGKIAQRLNEHRVPVWRWGSGWAKTHVVEILNSRSVLGEFQPCKMEGRRKRVPVGDPIKDYYPRVISDAEFYASRAVVKRRQGGGGRAINSVNNLFSGVCFCGQCGGPAHYIDKGGRNPKYLRCDYAARRLKPCKPSYHCYAPVEDAFIYWLVRYDFTGATKSERAAKVEELNAAKARRELARKKVERLTEAMAEADLPVSTFLPKIKQANEDATLAEAEIAMLSATVNGMEERAPIVDAAKLAKEPENRFRLREEIRRRIRRLMLFPEFVRVELPNGQTVDLMRNGEMRADAAAVIGGKPRNTRVVFMARSRASMTRNRVA